MGVKIRAQLAEKSMATFTIGTTDHPTITDSNGDTVVVTLTQYDTAGAAAIEVETNASGAVAGTAIATILDLATSGIAPGFWELEAVADKNGANPKTLIPNNYTGFPYVIEIKALNTF